MAGSLTNAAEVDLLRLLTGQATSIFTSTPLTPYVGLLTIAPTEGGAGTEAAGGGYARVSSAGAWGTPADGEVQNSDDVDFAEFTGTVSAGAPFVAFGLYTASSGGSPYAYGDLTDPTKNGAAGDQMLFSPGDLTLAAD